MIRQMIKPGEDVWFLYGDKIVKGMIRNDYYRDGDVFVDVTYRAANAAGQVVIRRHFCEARLLFESREALCEHYRKIFE